MNLFLLLSGLLVCQNSTTLPLQFFNERFSSMISIEVIESWLEHASAGRTDVLAVPSSPRLHASFDSESVREHIEPAIAVFGVFQSRSLRGLMLIQPETSSTGRLAILQYRTDFLNRKDNLETLLLVNDSEDSWQILGYHLEIPSDSAESSTIKSSNQLLSI